MYRRLCLVRISPIWWQATELKGDMAGGKS
jgi:hypothetical protein